MELPISGWPPSERPREKLIARGSQSLSNAELLAILLRTGVGGPANQQSSALGIGRKLLITFGSLRQVLAASDQSLRAIRGIGPAKIAQLKTVMELAKRILEEELTERPIIHSTTEVSAFLRLHVADRKIEGIWGLFLDNAFNLLAFEMLASGTLTRSQVYPREVAHRCLQLSANRLIIVHNHPSGDLRPSRSDVQFTETLKNSLACMEIELVDHILVAGNRTLSFVEAGVFRASPDATSSAQIHSKNQGQMRPKPTRRPGKKSPRSGI